MDCQLGNMFVNPFAYFGQPSLWPRGYPLEMISKTAVCTKFKVSNKMPLIQQGLVNGDSGEDAIYRFFIKNFDTLIFLPSGGILTRRAPKLFYYEDEKIFS